MPIPKKALGVAIALGVQHGPTVLEAAKKLGLTPEALLKQKVQTTDAKKHALEHADHLIDGSVLTVFEGDRKIYVVFTGDKPVASHPQTKTPLDRLVEGYDLAKRVVPGAPAQQAGKFPKPAFGRKGGAPVAPQPHQGARPAQAPSTTPAPGTGHEPRA